jgi:hypothetical protein
MLLVVFRHLIQWQDMARENQEYCSLLTHLCVKAQSLYVDAVEADS